MFESGKNMAVNAAICLKVAKTWLWMLLFCAWHVVYVTSWIRLACLAEVYIMLWTNHFLLFVCEKPANMAVPWGVWIVQKKYFCCLNIDRTAIQSLQMEMFAHFLHLQASLHLHWEYPWIGGCMTEGFAPWPLSPSISHCSSPWFDPSSVFFLFFFLLCSVLFYSGRETGLNIESHMFGWKGCWANMHIKNSLGSLKPKKGRESFPTCHGNVKRYSPWQQVHTVGIHWVTLLLWVLEPCGS